MMVPPPPRKKQKSKKKNAAARSRARTERMIEEKLFQRRVENELQMMKLERQQVIGKVGFIKDGDGNPVRVETIERGSKTQKEWDAVVDAIERRMDTADSKGKPIQVFARQAREMEFVVVPKQE